MSMKAPVKTASSFSGVACLLLLFFAGMLVKFAALTPMFHGARWH
jgi:hypothetical protein